MWLLFGPAGGAHSERFFMLLLLQRQKWLDGVNKETGRSLNGGSAEGRCEGAIEGDNLYMISQLVEPLSAEP